MIFPIPGIAGNDAASRRHQIRFFHPAVCRPSPGISGAGIFVSRGLPSIMTSDRYDVRLQTHRRDRIRGRSVVSGSHCDEQPCIPRLCNPRKQLLLKRSFRIEPIPTEIFRNSRMINPACVQHIPDAFYHGGNVSVSSRSSSTLHTDQTAAWRNSGHTDRWSSFRFRTGSLPDGFHARCRHTAASVRRQSLQILRFSRKDPDAARSRRPAPLPSHLFRKARLPLPRSRGQLSLPCSRHTHPFSFRIWRVCRGRGVLHFMEGSENRILLRRILRLRRVAQAT